MAFPANPGAFNLTKKDILLNDTAVDYLADSLKLALYTNTITTPNYDTNTGQAAAPFNANEITGTGYTAGGVVLTTPTVTITSGSLIFDTDDPSWTTATFSAVRGGPIYDNTIATPTNKPLLFLVTFGADFAVTAGTFTVQVAAGGWWNDDGTP